MHNDVPVFYFFPVAIDGYQLGVTGENMDMVVQPADVPERYVELSDTELIQKSELSR